MSYLSPFFLFRRVLLCFLWVGLALPGIALGFDASIYDAACLRIIRVSVKNDNVEVNSGTGFVVSQKGHIITNDHVIRGGDESGSVYLIIHRNGKKFTAYIAEPRNVLVTYEHSDLAVLSVPALTGAPYFSLASYPPAKSSKVHALGYPGLSDQEGARGAAFSSIIRRAIQARESNRSVEQVDVTDLIGENAQMRELFESSYNQGTVNKVTTGSGLNGKGEIQHSTPITEGNSGGPLFNDLGHVVGVIQSFKIHPHGRSLSLSPRITELTTFFQEQGIPVKFEEGSGANQPPGPSRAGRRWPSPVSILIAFIAAALVAGTWLIMSKRRNIAPVPPPLPPELKKRKQGGDQMVSDHKGWKLEGELEGRPIVIRLSEEVWRNSGDRVLVGRDPGLNHFSISHPSISRQHLQLIRHSHHLFIAQRNTKNRTSVNHSLLETPFQEHPLSVGDTIAIGSVKLKLSFQA